MEKHPKSIAVLPFVNMSSDSENDYFCDGITEEITNALAKIEELRVTSRTSSFFFKGKNMPVIEIGKQLGVATILEGSVRLFGKNMRITAQLIQADEDFHFWSETWDRQIDNIFEVQDEISVLIAEKIREQFGHLEFNEHLVTKQTDNLDAYTLFLKGRHFFNKWNPEDAKIAIQCYQKALELDPKHANSLVGLADAYSFLGTTGYIAYEEGWGKCAELTHKALNVNDCLPDAYYQLANIAFFTAADFSESIALIQKALAINPNHIGSRQFMSFLCTVSGKLDLARKHLEWAKSIDPLSQETQFYDAYLDYMQENFTSSLSKLEACLTVNPKNIPAHVVKTNCLQMIGKFDEVIHYYDSVPAEIVNVAEKIGVMALGYVANKDEVNASKYMKMTRELADQEDGFTADTYLFLIYSYTNQKEKAFDWVSNAMHNNQALLLLRFADPLVNPIKDDPRYNKFQQQLFPAELFIYQLNNSNKKALLNSKNTAKYQEKLFRYMEDAEPFLNPDLSLRSLANQLAMQPNQLSWLLNECLGKNFNEFINQYRVKTFKRLAKDANKSHLTVIGLAFESGFNSKTVFNTYFKKETNLTPKQYLKSL